MFDIKYMLASDYIKNKIPFILYKPNLNSLDRVIPYLSKTLGYNLLKIAISDLGLIVSVNDALHAVKEVVRYNIKDNYIIWIEDIGVVDCKDEFVRKVIELNNNNPIVFSCVDNMIFKSSLPFMHWDVYFAGSADVEMTYVQSYRCSTTIQSPVDLHFRVYSNIIKELVCAFKEAPEVLIEVKGNRLAPLSSLVLVSSLNIRKDEWLKVITNEKYVKHIDIVDCIKRGLTNPTPLIYNL